MAYKYPNLAAEMSRHGYDYGAMYDTMAEKFKKSSDTMSNWITGRAGELPTKVAFAIKDEYFPELSVDYLFNEKPMLNATIEQF